MTKSYLIAEAISPWFESDSVGTSNNFPRTNLPLTVMSVGYPTEQLIN